jgi:hypothetical protein
MSTSRQANFKNDIFAELMTKFKYFDSFDCVLSNAKSPSYFYLVTPLSLPRGKGP